MSTLKRDPYLASMYIGDTYVDICGDGRREIYNIYIADTDISLWEMIHGLGVWDKVEEMADEAIYHAQLR
jgi:hypothetical protein